MRNLNPDPPTYLPASAQRPCMPLLPSSLQRVEQALGAVHQTQEGLERTLLTFGEALLELEGARNERTLKNQNGQQLRLVTKRAGI